MTHNSAFEELVANLKQARMKLPLVNKAEYSKKFDQSYVQPLGEVIAQCHYVGLSSEKVRNAKNILESSLALLDGAIRLCGESSQLMRDYLILIGAGGAFGYGTAFNIKRHGVTETPFALTSEQRETVELYLNALKRIYELDFLELQKDPDKGGAVSESSKDEAVVGMALRECGQLPEDIQRPPLSDHGEFYSPSTGRCYDIKGLHSDWPPLNNQRDKSKPFQNAYGEKTKNIFIKNIERQIFEKNRIVILDLRNANREAVEDIRKVVTQRGWNKDVIWFP